MITLERGRELLAAVGCEHELQPGTTIKELRDHWEYHFDRQDLSTVPRDMMIAQSRALDVFIKALTG